MKSLMKSWMRMSKMIWPKKKVESAEICLRGRMNLRVRLRDESSFVSPSSFFRSFSFVSRILFAVPTLERLCCIRHDGLKKRKGTKITYFVLNSSGTSTDGFPSAFNLASTHGFSSCWVREGCEMYGRVDLYSKMKWPVIRFNVRLKGINQRIPPVPRHFWQTVEGCLTAGAHQEPVGIFSTLQLMRWPTAHNSVGVLGRTDWGIVVDRYTQRDWTNVPDKNIVSTS